MTEIRDATAEDLDAVAALDVDLFGADGWSTANMAAEFAAAGRTREVLVAVSDVGRVFGYAISLALGEVVDVQRIGVTRETQRQGVGTGLMEVLMDRALVAGCERMLLEVDAHSAAAIAFYRRLGFREIGRRPGYYHAGVDALVLELQLSGEAAES